MKYDNILSASSRFNLKKESPVAKFAIWLMDVKQGKKGPVCVSFTAVMSPVNLGNPLLIESEGVESAAKEASELLFQLKADFYTLLSHEEGVHPYPNYFVGEVRWDEASTYDNAKILYRISNFVAVKTT